MTDEEMAEKYAKSIVIFDRDFHNDRFAEIEQAFLAGLKAGRPKWHKVADGDLPKHCDYGTRTSEYVLVRFKSGNKGICYFDFDLLSWFANGYSERLENIIEWCEIPKYTEEINYEN